MMNVNNMRGIERKEETPPYSRLFVVCSKQLKTDDLRERFESFGAIEDLYIPKDRNTGESKGVAYVKYLKTSSAAAAIQDLHQKVFSQDNKPMKVMIAVNRNESPTQSDNEDKYRRLFIKVPKDITESEVRQHFSVFGHVDHVRLQRDKVTEMCKGFAYVQYRTFFDAAKAFEECDRNYKPVFATPREDLKRSRNSVEMCNEKTGNGNFNNFNGPKCTQNNDRAILSRTDYIAQEIRNNSLSSDLQDFNNITVVCSPQVPQKYIKKIFEIVPGMVQCQYSVDAYNGISKALITYETHNSAAYALEKLNNFEFPSGEIITVKPHKNPLSKAADDLTDMVNSFKNAVDSGTGIVGRDLMQLANVIASASSLIKSVTLTTGHSESHVALSNDLDCSVTLPPPMPMLDNNSRVAQRLFIICKPQPPPISTLQDVFCRFGDLIQVSTIPNKTFGFVKYASEKSAREAINTLNGAVVSGIRLKVMEADEKPGKDVRVTETADQNTDYDMDSKRMKLDD